MLHVWWILSQLTKALTIEHQYKKYKYIQRNITACSCSNYICWKARIYYILRMFGFNFFYPACNVQAPYFVRCIFHTYHVLLRYVINSYILDKIIEYRMCSSVSSTTLSESFHIFRRTFRDIVKELCSSRKIPAILGIFWRNFWFSTDFQRIIKY